MQSIDIYTSIWAVKHGIICSYHQAIVEYIRWMITVWSPILVGKFRRYASWVGYTRFCWCSWYAILSLWNWWAEYNNDYSLARLGKLLQIFLLRPNFTLTVKFYSLSRRVDRRLSRILIVNKFARSLNLSKIEAKCSKSSHMSIDFDVCIVITSAKEFSRRKPRLGLDILAR